MSGSTERGACVVCQTGRRAPGQTTITLNRGETTIVFRGVPADVCETCGEAYLDAATGQHLEQLAEAAIAGGVKYELRDYVVSAA